MRSIQGFRVADRLDAGETVLQAAIHVPTGAIKKRLGQFAAQHRSFAAAHKLVEQAEQKLHEARDRMGTLDALQDEAVDALAVALVGEGEPRMSPFKRFRAPPPSTLRVLGDVAEAKAALALINAVRTKKSLSRSTLDALKNLEKASKAVLAASKPIEKHSREMTLAIMRREGIAQGWSNAFAALKQAARLAEYDGASGLYATLFMRVRPRVKRKTSQPVTPPSA